MEDNKKLTLYLPILGISLILLFSSVTCNYHSISEYSFLNKLEQNVELFLYLSNDPFEGRVQKEYSIKAGEKVKFVTMETNEHGNGYGEAYFCQFVDSAKLRIAGNEEFVAIWRHAQEPVYVGQYQMKWNFLCEWYGMIQHGGSHCEYIYWLELVDE